MSIIDGSLYKKFDDIPKNNKSIVVYNSKKVENRLEHLQNLTNIKFVVKNYEFGYIALYVNKQFKFAFLKNKKKLFEENQIIIFGPYSKYNFEQYLFNYVDIYYQEFFPPLLFRNIYTRIAYGEYLDSLTDMNTICNDTNSLSKLGAGSYGSVYNSGKGYAIKLARIDKKRNKTYDSTWVEKYILENICKPLLTQNICPNLPLVYNIKKCGSCKLELIKDKIVNSECLASTIELADSNLKHYLKNKRSPIEIYSCLFQILAGLHAIQLNGQIMNFDIKKENVLCYNTIKGGYWHYRIREVDYYVPNTGTLFVLNDFGISSVYSPDYEHKNFGTRAGLIKDNKIIPLDMKYSDGYKMKWYKNGKLIQETNTGKLRNNEIEEQIRNYLINSEEFPPFEFYNDVQDVLRIFTGGKRTTQKGNHSEIKGSGDIKQQLKKYAGIADSLDDHKMSFKPYHILAGHFITKFFIKHCPDFLIKPDPNEILNKTVYNIKLIEK